MKTSLKFLVTAFLAAVIIIPITGCATTSGGGGQAVDTDKISKLVPALKATVSGAVIYAQSKDANTIKRLPHIKTAVAQFANGIDLSAASLRLMINALPIPELKTLEAQLIITPVIALYDAYGAEYVKSGIAPSAGFKMLLEAIRDGIEEGEAGIKATQ